MNLIPILFLSTFGSLKLISAACHVDDEAGLLGFKLGITHDPSGMLNSWKKGTDCCSWDGVFCHETSRVTHISLVGDPSGPNALSGAISPSLVKLQYLEIISFHHLRNITGTFPTFLFGLPKLKHLYLLDSKLSGQLPGNIGKLTQLESLNLEGNRFTGPIPSSISELTQLAELSLGFNSLTGTIPSGITKLKKLKVLSLNHNTFSGAIPDFFTAFTDLDVLELSNNKFSGPVPTSLSSLAPKLEMLLLGHNALTGKIPDFIGDFQKLRRLDLSWNKFTGTVPKTFSRLVKTTLYDLDLSHNSLEDPFPALVKGPVSIDLSYNNFHLKEIPSWVTSVPYLQSLKLAKCGIKMNLDKWKPKKTQEFQYIDLSDNEISGSPVGLLNMTQNLITFRASGNQLKFDLGSLKIPFSLMNLDLSRNLIFGKVPNMIFGEGPKTVSGLESLNVSHNHLCGKLPPTKFPASVFEGNDCLCGSPLPPCK